MVTDMKNPSLGIALLLICSGCDYSGSSGSPDAVSLDAVSETADVVSGSDDGHGELDVSDGSSGADSSTEPEVPEDVELGLPALSDDPGSIVIDMPGDVGVQPAVAVGEGGAAIVVFTATPGAEGDLSIYASFDGGEAIALKADPPGQRNEPSVCRLSGGGFVAVWSYDGQAVGNTLGVEGAILDAAGALTTTFEVKTEVPGNHWLGHVGCDPSGGFTVVGSRTDTDDTTFGIFAKSYDAAGVPVGSTFGVNPEPDGTQVQPVVGVGPSGSGVVLYEDAPQDEDYVLTARVFDASGPIGDPFTLLGQPGVDCVKPAVAISPGGVVAYAGNRGAQVVVSTAPSLSAPEPTQTWLETTGSHGLAALTFLERDDVLAAARIENVTGAGAPGVRLVLLGDGVGENADSALLGDDPQLPPYPPAVAYGGGTLAVAWTQRTEQGYEVHLSQFKAAPIEP